MAEKLKVLLTHSAELTRTKGLEGVLLRLMNLARSLVDADRSSIFLHDKERGELWTIVAHDVSEIRIPQDAGIAGHVFRTGEGLCVADAARDPRFHPAVDETSGYRTGNLLAVPLRAKRGGHLGVLEVVNKEHGKPFSGEDMDLLAHVALYASSAIENAELEIRLRQMETERLAAYARLAQAVAHEIRNPLMALGGLLQRMAGRETDPSAGARLETLLAEVRRLDGVMREVDRFVGLPPPVHGQVSLKRLVQGAFEAWEDEWRRANLHPSFSPRSEDLLISLDATLVQEAFFQIFREILRRPPGGTLLPVEWRSKEGEVEIVLGEVSKGMRLSEPLTPELGGQPWRIGLHLLMAHKILSDHGGRLCLAAESDSALPLVIRLPRKGPFPGITD